MARKDRNTQTTNVISGNVIGSNVQTGSDGVWIGGTYYPDGIPAGSDVINGRVVPRDNGRRD